jgi:hypothetical protein
MNCIIYRFSQRRIRNGYRPVFFNSSKSLSAHALFPFFSVSKNLMAIPMTLHSAFRRGIKSPGLSGPHWDKSKSLAFSNTLGAIAWNRFKQDRDVIGLDSHNAL